MFAYQFFELFPERAVVDGVSVDQVLDSGPFPVLYQAGSGSERGLFVDEVVEFRGVDGNRVMENFDPCTHAVRAFQKSKQKNRDSTFKVTENEKQYRRIILSVH
ncbi:MAG: hypothetical protein PHV51_02680 [Methanosarcinaceae archaeon]|nr:hypothetical protein [Methanosarcinaceae archaeon]